MEKQVLSPRTVIIPKDQPKVKIEIDDIRREIDGSVIKHGRIKVTVPEYDLDRSMKQYSKRNPKVL